MAWAHAFHWREVLEHPAARRNKALHARLHHLHLAQSFYAQFLLGRDPFLTEPRNFRTAKDLARYARKAHEQIDQAWRQPGAPRRDDPVAPPRAAVRAHARRGVPPGGLSLTHHRGQNALHMRRLKLEPETVDYVLWVWKGRPAADWSFLDE